MQACLVLSGYTLSGFWAVVFSGSFARLLCYLPTGQSSMCKSTPPVDRRAKPCTPAKFRAKNWMRYKKKLRAVGGKSREIGLKNSLEIARILLTEGLITLNVISGW